MSDLLAKCSSLFPLDSVMELLASLSQLDRYQASIGIQAAATLVADAARTAGLKDVEVLQFPATGARRWWTFREPVSWTPIRAELRTPPGSDTLLTSYATQPCSLATYSASTPAAGRPARLVPLTQSTRVVELRGAIAMFSAPDLSLPDLLAQLGAAGAVGLVTSMASRRGYGGREQTGRIELPSDTPLFAFSVMPSVMRTLQRMARTHSIAHAVVEIDRTASMPVVTGHLPGRADREAWVLAHLCHPAPGANDNASGVAASLGVAKTLAAFNAGKRRASRQLGVRFVWGPEILGTAAYLNERAGGDASVPAFVLNLDMVGENQRLCGCPLIVELPPDYMRSSAPALIGRLLESMSNSPLVEPGELFRWRTAPFAGRSDHSLFADRSVACPAVLLSHYPDRFNHSSEDTLDKVDPAELLRCGTLSAAALTVICRATPMERPLTHDRSELLAPSDRNPVVRRRWPGPFNVRGMFEDLPPHSRLAAQRLVARDKGAYDAILAIALAIDERSSRKRVIDTASQWRRYAIGPDIGNRIIDWMHEAGWVHETAST